MSMRLFLFCRYVHLWHILDSTCKWSFFKNLCLRKLKQGLCINLEGWGREGDGREVQEGMDICVPMADSWASFVAQSVKKLPAVQKTWVRSLGWKDPLEKEMATYSSILTWKISWTEEPGGLQSMGLQSIRYNWATDAYLLMADSGWGLTENNKIL